MTTGHDHQALVSVVIPCYNQARFLGEAIQSVTVQTYRSFEIVVVDDGATDATASVAARYPGLRYVWQHNQGLSSARNTGLQASTGSLLVFLDADDRLDPGALQVGVEQLAMRPECAFVFGRCRYIEADGAPLPFVSPAFPTGNAYEAFLRLNCIANPAMVMFRRSVFSAIGDFDRAVNAAADWDLYLRVTRRFPIIAHDSVVVEYRRHPANMSADSVLMLKTCLAVVQRQGPLLRGQAERAAWKTGLHQVQETYGGRLLGQLRRQLWRRQWRKAGRSAFVLARYYPSFPGEVIRWLAWRWSTNKLTPSRHRDG